MSARVRKDDNAPVVPAWTHGGVLENIADPNSMTIDWNAMASTLGGLPRFGKRHAGPGISVAQHCVMGADAIHRETGENRLSALFLLHDGHEFIIGDLTTPVAQLLALHIEAALPPRHRGAGIVKRGINAAKAAIDRLIYDTAGLPDPEEWPDRVKKLVADMDFRMFEAEATALYGPRIWDSFRHSGMPAPKLTGTVLPAWGCAKAEEAFIDRLRRYAGIVAPRTGRAA